MAQPSLKTLAGRRFAFYPAIRNVSHNEWTIERETWSEILVANAETSLQIWIPRPYVSGVSSSDSPLLIVGLNRELEFHAGAVWPYRERLVEMPDRRNAPAGNGPPDTPASSAPAPGPIPARVISPSEWKIGRFVGLALAFGVAACLLAVLFVFEGAPNPVSVFWRPGITTADQRYLGLTGSDGYFDVVTKIGAPEREQWLTGEDAEIQFQALSYPARSYAVVMMGGSRAEARYIGALHLPSRRTLDTVKLSGGGTTRPVLKNLPQF